MKWLLVSCLWPSAALCLLCLDPEHSPLLQWVSKQANVVMLSLDNSVWMFGPMGNSVVYPSWLHTCRSDNKASDFNPCSFKAGSGGWGAPRWAPFSASLSQSVMFGILECSSKGAAPWSWSTTSDQTWSSVHLGVTTQRPAAFNQSKFYIQLFFQLLDAPVREIIPVIHTHTSFPYRKIKHIVMFATTDFLSNLIFIQSKKGVYSSVCVCVSNDSFTRNKE